VPGLVRLDKGQTRCKKQKIPDMQSHPFHAEGNAFVQPNEALGTFKQAFPVAQKGQAPFPPNGSRIVGGGWRKSPSRLLRQRWASREGEAHFHDKCPWLVRHPRP